MIHKNPTGTNGPWNGALWNAIKRDRDQWPKRILLQSEEHLEPETVTVVRSLAIRVANITRQEAMPVLLNQDYAQLCGSLTALIQGAGLAGVRFMGETAYTYGTTGRPLERWIRCVETSRGSRQRRRRARRTTGRNSPTSAFRL